MLSSSNSDRHIAHSSPYFVSCLISFTVEYMKVGKACTSEGSSPLLEFTTTKFTVGLFKLLKRFCVKNLQRQMSKNPRKKKTTISAIKSIVSDDEGCRDGDGEGLI